jgi:hypothetical protein
MIKKINKRSSTNDNNSYSDKLDCVCHQVHWSRWTRAGCTELTIVTMINLIVNTVA